MKLHTRTNESLTAFLFLLPALLLLIGFRFLPLLEAVRESFYQVFYERGGYIKEFVGLLNFMELVSNPRFWNSFRVTLLFNIIVTPLQIILAIILAILLTKDKKGIHLIRSLYLIPIGMSDAIASVIWRILLNPNDGLINGLLGIIGFSNQPFYTHSSQALWSIILIASWKGIAYWMIFLVAGINDIPVSLFEQAKIDGASPIKSVIHITLPLLKRVILFVTVANTIANFLLFAPFHIITRGGPAGSTNVLMYEAYRTGFIYNDLGSSMAIITILIIILIPIIGVEFKLLQSEH